MACFRRAAAMAIALVAPAMSGCGASVFACGANAQCGGDGAVCEAGGWCSFPDAECPSGRRYGELSGDGLGGVCVPGETTDDPSASASTGNSTSAGTLPPLESSADADATTLPLTDGVGPPDTSSTGELDGEGSSGSSSTGAPEGPSPVAWYTFDDPDDPWADASGNELHAWCGGPECPELAKGIVGPGAIGVDGVMAHLHVDHAPQLEITDALTVAVWAQMEALPQNDEFLSIFAKPVGAAALNTWQIGVDIDGQLCGGGGNDVEQRGACVVVDEPVGVWHHIALTWGDDQLTLYVDGVARETDGIVDLAYDNTQTLIGADVNYEADAAFFQGWIDDARIYDRVLLEDEIAALVGG